MTRTTIIALALAAAGLGVGAGSLMRPDIKPAAAEVPTPTIPVAIQPQDADYTSTWYVGTATDGCRAMTSIGPSETADEFLAQMVADGIEPPWTSSTDGRLVVLYDPSGEVPVMILAQGDGFCSGALSGLY